MRFAPFRDLGKVVYDSCDDGAPPHFARVLQIEQLPFQPALRL